MNVAGIVFIFSCSPKPGIRIGVTRGEMVPGTVRLDRAGAIVGEKPATKIGEATRWSSSRAPTSPAVTSSAPIDPSSRSPRPFRVAAGRGFGIAGSELGSVDASLTGQPLVLAGRVPVKVSLENGPIAIGDFLGLSSKPGVAMRMTEPGAGVGIALAAFDGHGGAAGTVLCFVKVGEVNMAVEVARLRAENAALPGGDRLASRQEMRRLAGRLDRLEGPP